MAIACDLALVHASRGTRDTRYAAAQRQFAAKFPQLAAPDGSHRHWYAMPAADPAAAAALHGKLLAAWALPPDSGGTAVRNTNGLRNSTRTCGAPTTRAVSASR